MNRSGDDLRVRTRRALLDALDALEGQRDALVVIGAQALYFHTGSAPVAMSEETKDADIGIDRTKLREDPRIEAALEDAGFHRDLKSPQPGTWINTDGIPVDLMVPEAMAGEAGSNRRGARIPPHDKGAMRRAIGLEGTVVDNAVEEVRSLEPGDERAFSVRMAGPGALLVAKLHKVGERSAQDDKRLRDKDAHDLYRLLVAVDTQDLAEKVLLLLRNEFSLSVAEQALNYLEDLFAAGPDAMGSIRAGRAEEGIGEPETVAASVSILADDLLVAIDAGMVSRASRRGGASI